jgi:hypothetical protein
MAQIIHSTKKKDTKITIDAEETCNSRPHTLADNFGAREDHDPTREFTPHHERERVSKKTV